MTANRAEMQVNQGPALIPVPNRIIELGYSGFVRVAGYRKGPVLPLPSHWLLPHGLLGIALDRARGGYDAGHHALPLRMTDMLINCAAYKAGHRVAEIDLDQADRIESKPGDFVWVGLHEPDESLLRVVQQRFGLHDLAVEDAHMAHERPKLEAYGESLFVVLRTAQLKDGKIGWGETHIFAGPGYVVTVRHGSTTAYKTVRARCESAPQMLSVGESFVIYSVMDFVVDNYFPVLHELEAEVDALEDSVFSQNSARLDVERVFELRHELLLMRRAVLPLQEVCSSLIRFDMTLIAPEMRAYFRDVQDHVIRVVESIDNLRELLKGALEANLLLASVQQNDVTKQLAAWAAILAVPTAIAGIYGMNFKYMPELDYPAAYPIVLTVIAGLCGYLYYRFKRSGWL